MQKASFGSIASNTTGVAFAAITGQPVPEGYQHTRYDPESNRIVGNTIEMTGNSSVSLDCVGKLGGRSMYAGRQMVIATNRYGKVVQVGEGQGTGDDGLHDERHVGELHAALGVGVLVLAAQLLDVGEVDLEDRVHVCRGLLRLHHVLGDALAHHRERLEADVLAFGELRRGTRGARLWGWRR